MKKARGRLIKAGAALLLAAVMVAGFMPLIPVQQAMAAGALESIAIPKGGFNSGNTGTTETKDVRLSGNAALTSDGGIMIVGNVSQQRGGAFFTNPINEGSGFSASFRMHMGNGSGQVADGFTFIIANGTNQVGGTGQGIGYSGITKSVAIEFDTYDNKSGGGNGTVPHIWYGVNGSMDTSDNNRSVVFEPTSPRGSISTKRNSKGYDVYGWIEYNPNVPEIRVTYSSSSTRPSEPTFILRGTGGGNGWEGNTYVAYDNKFKPSDLGNTYYVGFTAATGGSMQETKLMSFSAYGELTNAGSSKFVTINGEEVDVGTGIDLPPIIPPQTEDEDEKFRGLWSRDNGKQYYDEKGNPIHVNDLDEDDVLLPRFSYTIKLRNQGVADGKLDANELSQLPATLAAGNATIPIRDGFEFMGYYDDILADAVKYYDADGNLTDEVRELIWQPYDRTDPDNTGPSTLYAKWRRLDSLVNIDLNGGAWSEEQVPVGLIADGGVYVGNDLQGGVKINLPKPTRANYIFTGWSIIGSGGSLNGDVLTLIDDSGVSLIAQWFDTSTTGGLIKYNTGEKDIIIEDDEGLLAAFEPENLVSVDDEGITATDLLADGGVSLALYVNDIEKESDVFKDAIDQITALAEGRFSRAALEKLTFYEIYVEKTVGVGEESVTTRLKSLPQHVTVHIPLGDDIKDFSGYTVFQRHDGIVDEISVYEGNFTIVGGDLVLQVKNFSEFAVLPNGKHIHFEAENYDLYADEDNRFRFEEGSIHGTTEGNWDDMNVNARIVELYEGAVYKIDVEWGDMKFKFSLDYIWDIENRLYLDEKNNDWVGEGYQGGNNKITVTNHSNDGVNVSFETSWKADFLDGIEVEVKRENEADAEEAFNIPLARVPYSEDPAPFVETWLRMQGSPDVEAFKSAYDEAVAEGNEWIRVATITVTITPHGKENDLTPTTRAPLPVEP